MNYPITKIDTVVRRSEKLRSYSLVATSKYKALYVTHLKFIVFTD